MNKLSLLNKILIYFFVLLFVLSAACDSKDDDNIPDNQLGEMWDPSWMIGTWEGTTPATVTPFENTSIRIVIEEFEMVEHDTMPNGVRKAYAYSGTFYWDVDGNSPWQKDFYSENYLDYNVIIWDCIVSQGGWTTNVITFRIADDQQTDIMHTIALDFGPYPDDTGNAPTFTDLYGTIDIDINGVLYQASYPPDASTIIRLSKK